MPSSRSGGSAFSEPALINRNIISLEQRVQGHIKAPTKVKKEHYTAFFEGRLPNPRYPALSTSKTNREKRDSRQSSKVLDVYAIRFINTAKAGQLKEGISVRTVKCKAPSGSVAVDYQSKEIGLRHALGTRKAEIGIASFTDHALLRESLSPVPATISSSPCPFHVWTTQSKSGYRASFLLTRCTRGCFVGAKV